MFWSFFLFLCLIVGISSTEVLMLQKKMQLTTSQPSYQVKQVLLLGFLFDMTWTSTDVQKQFGYFDSLSGEGAYYLAFDPTLQSNSTRDHINTAIYILFDPKYYDKKLAVISIPLIKTFNNLTEKWQGSTTSTLELYNHLKPQQPKVQIPNTNFIINQKQTRITSQFFSFTTVLKPPVYQSILPWVLLLPSLLMLVSMHFVAIADINPMKISLLTLFINLIFLLFISLIELYYGVMDINNPQGWLIFTGVITFSTVIRFVQCFEPVIRRINGIKGYLQFYALIFVYIWCLFSYGTTRWFMIINSLFFLPQIIHNAFQGIKPGFFVSYITTICLSQFYIIYYKGCPENILRISPSYWTCFGVILSLMLQIGFMYLQHKFGSRFFIPRKCIPGYHNYIQLMVQDCTICLLPLSEQPGTVEDFEQGKKTQLYVESKITKKIMRTPCNHRFHVTCLETWMEQKMECPIDRSKLPPLEV